MAPVKPSPSGDHVHPEHRRNLCRVIRCLSQSLGIPTAAVGDGEEVSVIDMQRQGQLIQRIGDRMDDVAPQDGDIPLAEGPRASGLDFSAVGLRQPAPEDIVLAPAILPMTARELWLCGRVQ